MSTESEKYLAGLQAALGALDHSRIDAICALLETAYREGRTVFIAGNGGSAATASHMACDLSKTILGSSKGAKRLKAIALTDNVPVITAWANDVGYDCVFAEQLRTLASAGDVLIAISASGNSPNILRCLEAAREMGVHAVGLLGFTGGEALTLCDDAVVVESQDYGVVEDAHSVLNHMITMLLKTVISGN
jgi:D-sedoheptulose 7-phosphate isomerase